MVEKVTTVKAEVRPVAKPEVAKPTLDELKKQLATAIATGNDAEFNRIVATIAKMKSELAKAAAESAKKEAEALAGVREQVATAVYKAVKALNLDDALIKVKAQGFTYRLDAPDAEGVMVHQKSAALLVPTVKTARGGTTGGGKSKDEYGMSLGTIFDKFANEEDQGKLAEAETNSKQWQVKVAVKKRAIAEGLLQPVK